MRVAAFLLAGATTFFAAGPARAQDTDRGFWFAYAGQGHFDYPNSETNWRWWFDAHLRFFDESDGFETSIVRPGLGYDLSEHWVAWCGYAWIRNDPRDVDPFNEHRIWQQLTWGRRYDWGALFSRTRLEQRFDERGGETGWRMRQFVRWTQPVSEGSRLGWRVWNEAFFDLNHTDWGQDTGFRQNRLFTGLGWTFDEARMYTLEFGYLNQHLHRDGADDASNHVLAMTLLLNR